MHIYGSSLSPYVARVAIAARYKGIKYTVGAPDGGLKSPAFLKLNPLGKMPTITDGKTVVFESGVIVEYLDDKYKKKSLVPKAAKAAAEARMIGAVFSEYVQGSISKLFAHMAPGRDEAAVAAIFIDIDRYLTIAENMIAAKPFAAGAKITIADCYAAATLGFASLFLPRFGASDYLDKYKKLSRYLAKAKKDKAIGGVLKEMAVAYTEWSNSQPA